MPICSCANVGSHERSQSPRDFPSGLYTAAMFLPSSCFARASKASSGLESLFLYHPNHLSLSFSPSELICWDNQNRNCTQSSTTDLTGPWRMLSALVFLPTTLTSYCEGYIYHFHGHVPSAAHYYFVVN